MSWKTPNRSNSRRSDLSLDLTDIEEVTGQKMELRLEGDVDHPAIDGATESALDGDIS